MSLIDLTYDTCLKANVTSGYTSDSLPLQEIMLSFVYSRQQKIKTIFFILEMIMGNCRWK